MNGTDEGLRGRVMGLGDLVAYQAGAVVSRTLIDEPAGTVTLFAFDEGQGLSEHTAPFDAMVTMVDGEAEVTVGDEVHTVERGQMIITPADVPHALRARQRFKMLLVLVRQ